MTKYEYLHEHDALRQISTLEALTNSELSLTPREEALLDALRYLLDRHIDSMSVLEREYYFKRSPKK